MLAYAATVIVILIAGLIPTSPAGVSMAYIAAITLFVVAAFSMPICVIEFSAASWTLVIDVAEVLSVPMNAMSFVPAIAFDPSVTVRVRAALVLVPDADWSICQAIAHPRFWSQTRT